LGAAPIRLHEAEQILVDGPAGDDTLRAAGEAAAQAIDPDDDIHASAVYRRRLTSTLVRRAVQEILGNEAGS